MRLVVIWLLLSLSMLAENASAAECKQMHDSAARLGCHDRNISRKTPGWEKVEACTQHSSDHERLKCFDTIAGKPEKASGVLHPALCVTEKDPDKRLACFSTGYRPLIDKDQVAYCLTLTDQAEQLGCFDRLHLRVAKAKIERSWVVQVREKGMPTAAALEEPASLGFIRSDGKTHGHLKASVIARSPAWSDSGWYGQVALDINQDLGGNTRTNSKALSAAASGPLLDYPGTGVGGVGTFKAKFNKNSELHTESAQLLLDNRFVIDGLATGTPWAPKGSFQLYPTIGIGYQDWSKVKAGDTKGNATSAYVALNGAAWLPGLRRLQLNASAQRFVDTRVSDGRTKRRDNYYTVGIDYHFYDPLDPPKTFTPMIGLKREVGSNPFDDTVRRNRTSLLIRFKLDLVP